MNRLTLSLLSFFFPKSLCLETEQIGNNTLEQMGRQREQLGNANRNISATREIAEQARVILTNFGRKALYNKIFLYCLIGVLLVANFYAFMRLFKK